MDKGNYYGIEPEVNILTQSIKKDIGDWLIQLKKPKFNHNSDFKIKYKDKATWKLAASIIPKKNFV